MLLPVQSSWEQVRLCEWVSMCVFKREQEREIAHTHSVCVALWACLNAREDVHMLCSALLLSLTPLKKGLSLTDPAAWETDTGSPWSSNPHPPQLWGYRYVKSKMSGHYIKSSCLDRKWSSPLRIPSALVTSYYFSLCEK